MVRLYFNKKSIDFIIIETNNVNENVVKTEKNERINLRIVAYTVKIVSSPSQFKIGEKFSMDCQYKPQMRNVTYAWYKNGQSVGDKLVLSFKSLKQADLGSYKCIVTGKTENGAEMQLEASASQRMLRIGTIIF